MPLPGGGYVGNAVTKTSVDKFIPEIWGSEIQRARDSKFVATSTMKKVSFVGKKGDRLHIPIIKRAAVNVKLPETPVTLQARTENEYLIDIDTYKESSFMIEDIAAIQNNYELRSIYTAEAGYALARDMDNAALALRAAIHNLPAQRIFNTVDGTQAGTPSGLNEAAILAAKEILDKKDVPMEGRVLIVSPEQYNSLLTINAFINMDFVDDRPVRNGLIGRLYGINVIMTSQITANSATGYTNGDGAAAQPTPGVAASPYLPTQEAFTGLPTTIGTGLACYSALLCHPDWAIAAVQMTPKVESSRETLFQADAVVTTQLYGMKTYRQDHAVVIHTRD